jgi:hypothetical protein
VSAPPFVAREDARGPEARRDVTEWVFDRNGVAQIIRDGDCFRSAEGKVIGWIRGNAAYALSGRHVACYDGGVLYDTSGFAIGFCAGARGFLPSRPALARQPDAMPGFADRPARPDLASRTSFPGFAGWSPIRLARFFR